MQCDLYVHTQYSFDSSAKMEDYCAYAVKMGIEAVCFTEHYDCDRDDKNSFYFQPEFYFAELERMREIYRGKLRVLGGVEISEPHLYPEEIERLSDLSFDMLMGSVHIWDFYHSSIIGWKENASAQRKGKKMMPDRELLELYMASGGKYVTTGSDAHKVVDLETGLAEADFLAEWLFLQTVVIQKGCRI